MPTAPLNLGNASVSATDAERPRRRLRLIAGTNLTITVAEVGDNELSATFAATGGGGGGAPTDAQYVVLSADGTLTDERVLTAGTNITFTDGGAGGTLTVDAATGAPSDSQYVVLSADGDLSAERVLTAGEGISFTDGGAGSALTVDFNGSYAQDLSGASPYGFGNNGDYVGEVLKLGNTTTVASYCYQYGSSGWAGVDADAESTSTGMLGLALSTNSGSHGMLLKGYMRIAAAAITGLQASLVGSPVYLSTSTAKLTMVAPSGSGDVVRVCGYLIEMLGSDGLVWFDPAGTWVTIT